MTFQFNLNGCGRSGKPSPRRRGDRAASEGIPSGGRTRSLWIEGRAVSELALVPRRRMPGDPAIRVDRKQTSS